ncbi:hypothetical protein BLOT_006688 [Blomia tropicalis]|nr:hypothetical protein BLOT_006688 [Blomia tropicalis]
MPSSLFYRSIQIDIVLYLVVYIYIGQCSYTPSNGYDSKYPSTEPEKYGPIELPVYTKHKIKLIPEQSHHGKPGNKQISETIDEPWILKQFVRRPIIHKVHEVFIPIRHVVQEIKPVKQDIKSILTGKLKYPEYPEPSPPVPPPPPVVPPYKYEVTTIIPPEPPETTIILDTSPSYSTIISIVLLIAEAILACGQQRVNNSIEINDAVLSRQIYETKPIKMNSTKIVNPIIFMGSGTIPLQIKMQTFSSKLQITQEHTNSKPQVIASHSIDGPIIIKHLVKKPIIQKIHEIIMPKRKVIQVILPVKEYIKTIISQQQSSSTTIKSTSEMYDSSTSTDSSNFICIFILFLTTILKCYATKYGQEGDGDVPDTINAAVISRHVFKTKTVPSMSKPVKIPTIVIGSKSIPLTLEMQSSSSDIKIAQNHQNTEPQMITSNSVDGAIILKQFIRKPIIQKVHEIILPKRKIIQEFRPVKEFVKTIISKADTTTESMEESTTTMAPKNMKKKKKTKTMTTEIPTTESDMMDYMFY